MNGSFLFVFLQNAYVLNDSSSEHKISQKYDSDLDILRSYVDDAEKVSPRLMPDYANAVVFYSLEDSDRPTTHKSIYLYTAPSNGFIRIVDCFTAQDYFIYVNNSTDDYGTYARGHSAYHKCGSYLSCSGMFPITKGDVITMVYTGNSYISFATSVRYDSIFTFIPGKTRPPSLKRSAVL